MRWPTAAYSQRRQVGVLSLKHGARPKRFLSSLLGRNNVKGGSISRQQEYLFSCRSQIGSPCWRRRLADVLPISCTHDSSSCRMCSGLAEKLTRPVGGGGQPKQCTPHGEIAELLAPVACMDFPAGPLITCMELQLATYVHGLKAASSPCQNFGV